MKARIVSFAALIGCLSAHAGEIIFVQPTEKAAPSAREPSRSERELDRTQGKARRYAGTAETAPVVDELNKTEQSIRNAQDYLRPGAGSSSTGAAGTTVILRAAPQSETEKLRQKARNYIASDSNVRTSKCGEVVNSVGTIGEGPSAERSVNVIEKGNSAVIVNCK